LDIEKAKDFAVGYAKESLKQEISNNLKLLTKFKSEYLEICITCGIITLEE